MQKLDAKESRQKEAMYAQQIAQNTMDSNKVKCIIEQSN
jgi:hypothetical protein